MTILTAPHMMDFCQVNIVDHGMGKTNAIIINPQSALFHELRKGPHEEQIIQPEFLSRERPNFET